MRLDIERLWERPLASTHGDAGDDRFRRLFFAHEWDGLAPAIQRRFSKRLTGVTVAAYRGRIVSTRLSRAGWLLAQLCRAIGAPLPLRRDGAVPAVVVVSEDAATGGQRWTRIYHRRHGNPQVINSAKAFAGPTGLEEHIGGGIGMALRVVAAKDRIVFTSDHYFFRAGRARLRLPRWCAPGTTVVTHRDLGNGRFAFDLELRHALLGTLVHQHAIFSD